MKFLKILSLLVVLFAFTVACSAAGAEEESDLDKKRFSSSNLHLSVVTDMETGCQYIVYSSSNKAGITPLLSSEGEPDCTNK